MQPDVGVFLGIFDQSLPSSSDSLTRSVSEGECLKAHVADKSFRTEILRSRVRPNSDASVSASFGDADWSFAGKKRRDE